MQLAAAHVGYEDRCLSESAGSWKVGDEFRAEEETLRLGAIPAQMGWPGLDLPNDRESHSVQTQTDAATDEQRDPVELYLAEPSSSLHKGRGERGDSMAIVGSERSVASHSGVF